MRRNIIFAIIFLALFAYGCTPPDTRPTTDFRRGSEGIVMNFVQTMPPPTIYDDSNFDLIVEVRNRGAYPQDSHRSIGALYISGFDTNIINMYNSKNLPALEGKSAHNPEGGFDIVTFHGGVVDFKRQNIERYEANFKLDACYQYETIASETICIDPDPHTLQRVDKVCTPPSAYTFSGGQGGPVAVTRIEQTVLSESIQYKITIRNIGNGRVIDKNALARCPYDLDHTVLNKVRFSGRVSQEQLSCAQRIDPLTLINNEATIVCTIEKPSQRSAYTTPINIKLEYGYTSSATRRITILGTP